MAEPTTTTVVSVILDPLRLIFGFLRSLPWSYCFSWVYHVAVALPLRVSAIPLRFLGGVLFVVFSPLLYVLGYVYGWTTALLGFVASLQPLYTFFGTAATVGIITGLILSISSPIITSALGMHDDTCARPPRRRIKGKAAAYVGDGGGGGYSSDTEVSGEDDGDVVDEEETPASSSNEREWQWLEPFPSRRRPVAGLLSQTILEEDDDSEER